MSSSETGSDKMNPVVKPNAFPIDLAQKIALVKPTDSKGATVQAHPFRTQQPMRVVMPAGTVQTSGSAQIIQTHLMPQAMIKQGRTQISALPSRTMAQTSITVTRPLTPNSFMPRGVTTVTNISAPRGAIRAQTPPTISTVTNISTNFVRGTIPPRTPSPAGTVIPSGTTWMTNSQPVQLIRTSLGQPARTRIVSQSIPAATVATSNAGITTISANIVSSQATVTGAPGQIVQSQSNAIQAVSANNSTGQTFVATAVLPQRQQTATLVYSNVTSPQQFNAAAGGQRIAVANPISGPRPPRPIQIGTQRLPTAGIGVRASAGNISIRGPNIPVLAPPSGLPAGAATTVSTANLTAVAGLPAARIIQVQQPSTGGAQVLRTGQITGNLMTLHPLVVNSTNANNTNVRGTVTTTKVQPSLTITHVGKLATPTVNATASLAQGATITATIPASSAANIVHQNQQHATATTPIGIVMGTSSSQAGGHQPHQIAQIVNINQSGVNVGHGHQIQIIGSQQQGSSTVVPLTITPRSVGKSTSGVNAAISAQPVSAAAQIVRGNVNVVTSVSSNQASNNSNSIGGNANSLGNATINALPVAKVLPQQQNASGNDGPMPAIVSVSTTLGNVSGQSVFIHSRSPSGVTATPVVTNNTANNLHVANSQNTISFISSASGAYYVPASVHSNANSNAGAATSANIVQLPSITTTTGSLSSNATPNIISSSNQIITSAPITSIAYAPQAGSFAVVPSSNRATPGQVHAVAPISNVQNNQTNPVRFNPQLIVDGNSSQTIITMQPQQQHATGPVPHQTYSQQQSQAHQKSHPTGHILATVSGTKTTVQPARASTIITSNATRKRDPNETFGPAHVASIKSAVKNLNPTLLAMNDELPPPRPSSPGSSDGSTTVSATSSPGIDQQEQEEFNALSSLHQQNRSTRDDLQYLPIDAHFGHPNQKNHHHLQPIVPATSLLQARHATSAPVAISYQTQVITNNRNGLNEELTPRKRPRKQQFADSSPANKKLAGNTSNAAVPAPSTSHIPPPIAAATATAPTENSIGVDLLAQQNVIAVTKSNKDTPKPVEYYIKKPRTWSLLDGYKTSWKSTYNHFQRYSDVKPREERRPTVMDLANQAQVLQRVNGWKVYHLTSQMEDLAELENHVYDKLTSMLQITETHDQTADIDRVNDLIKGNMQRSKIVADSIHEARAQILKIFDHKTPVSDIIHRCASKRNFKKREKV